GRVPEAGRALDAGASLARSNGFPIAVTSFEVIRAAALIKGGDPSEGARHVVRAVQAIPDGYRASGATRRASHGRDVVRVGAAGRPAVPEARELRALSPGAGA